MTQPGGFKVCPQRDCERSWRSREVLLSSAPPSVMTESELPYNQPHLEEGHSDPGDVTHLLLRYPSRGLTLPKMPLGSLLLCRTRGLAEDVSFLEELGLFF